MFLSFFSKWVFLTKRGIFNSNRNRWNEGTMCETKPSPVIKHPHNKNRPSSLRKLLWPVLVVLVERGQRQRMMHEFLIEYRQWEVKGVEGSRSGLVKGLCLYLHPTASNHHLIVTQQIFTKAGRPISLQGFFFSLFMTLSLCKEGIFSAVNLLLWLPAEK